MEQEKEKCSKRGQMAKDGVLAENFTQNGWFCKIKPAFAIAKLKFSFVKKGTKAKESFDVYMDIEDMIIWSEDIRNKDFFRILDSEAKGGEKYPKHYKIETGEGAAKSVGFMVSSNGLGYVINGKTFVNGKNIYANVPVDRTWVRKFSFWFDICLKESQWVENMARKTLAASSSFFENDPADESSTEPVHKPSPGTTDSTISATGTGQRVPFSVSGSDIDAANKSKTEQPEKETSQNQNTNPEPRIETFKVRVINGFVDMKNGGKAMQVVTASGENAFVIVAKEMTTKSEFAEFYSMCSVSGAIVTFKGWIHADTDRIILSGFCA